MLTEAQNTIGIYSTMVKHASRESKRYHQDPRPPRTLSPLPLALSILILLTRRDEPTTASIARVLIRAARIRVAHLAQVEALPTGPPGRDQLIRVHTTD